MNRTFTDHHASTKAGRLARAVRRAALACVLVLGAGGAFAQQYGDRRDDRAGPPPGAQDGQRPGGRFILPPDRGPRQSDQRIDDSRMQQQDGDQGNRRGGRLTPDERRDLRRQINEAGNDLYQRRR
jgi:hypothetical protein